MTNNQHRNITANLNFIRTFLWIWINFHPAAPTGTKFLTQQHGRQIRLGQEHLAVSCREDTVIGEIVFKEIDRTNRHCKSLQIEYSSQKRSVKNMALELRKKTELAYAFETIEQTQPARYEKGWIYGSHDY